MKVIILITALVATLAGANVLETFKDFVNDHTITREAAAAMKAKHTFEKRDSDQHRRSVNDAQHRIRATRTKYGLANPLQGGP